MGPVSHKTLFGDITDISDSPEHWLMFSGFCNVHNITYVPLKGADFSIRWADKWGFATSDRLPGEPKHALDISPLMRGDVVTNWMEIIEQPTVLEAVYLILNS
jgi:hypothetical protein